MERLKYTLRKIAGLICVSAVLAACSTVRYVPVKETEYVHVHDTTFYHDTTIRYRIERERYADYAGLLDTLRLSTDYASARAYVDTAANQLKGDIESKPEKEIVVRWKERERVRDSLVYRDVPYPVEVEKPVRYIPWWSKFLSWIGVFALIALLVKFGLKRLGRT